MAAAPDVDLHRNALMGVRGLMKARLYKHAKTAGDVEDPTKIFAKQAIRSLTSIYLHVTTARHDENAFDVESCEDLLESLAYSLVKSLKVEPSIFCDICTGSDVFDFSLESADSGEPTQSFSGSFHQPLLWVWRELLLTMVLLEMPEEDVVASVRRALLASPLYDCNDWRKAPRHTIELLLRGGMEAGSRNDDTTTSAQKRCLPKLLSLCAARKNERTTLGSSIRTFEFDTYDTYDFNNDEEDIHDDTDGEDEDEEDEDEEDEDEEDEDG